VERALQLIPTFSPQGDGNTLSASRRFNRYLG